MQQNIEAIGTKDLEVALVYTDREKFQDYLNGKKTVDGFCGRKTREIRRKN